jgi:cyclic pyranopterin phosphate synthase
MDTHPLRMIDVGGKPTTPRAARASGRLLAHPDTIQRIREGSLEKGDAVAAARLAGIMAAKKTSDIVPLCHPLPLDSVLVTIDFDDPDGVSISATVRSVGRTGVEMEALVAVSAAALTLYDMTKSIDPGMTIDRIRLDEKTGGTRGDWRRGEGRTPPPG